MKSFKSILREKINNVYGLHFFVPADVVEFFKEKNINRFLISFNESEQFPRAIMPAGDGRFYIYLNKELQKKAKMRIGDEVVITMIPDESEYGMPLPAELEECFYQMPLGKEFFHQLSPGKQRSLIYMVAKPKRAETKAKKAYQIMSYLESVNGKLDYKELNQYFKETN